ncbi:MAG: hypothetical protein ACJAVV_003143 [Alphaproteobacteria bacterium]|jgi:hypothetical protein
MTTKKWSMSRFLTIDVVSKLKSTERYLEEKTMWILATIAWS